MLAYGLTHAADASLVEVLLKILSTIDLVLFDDHTELRRSLDSEARLAMTNKVGSAFFSPSVVGGFESPCVVCNESSSSRAFISAFVEPGVDQYIEVVQSG